MAYGLKYQSEFYNYFGQLVQVQIAKVDYSGSVTNVRTTEVTIEVNFQDHNTPIVGTGAKVVVVNEGDFTSLEDLLTSMEKTFQCTIIYDSVTVFKGFSICDLNEQEFLPKARITLQFTDYLRRLEGNYLTCLNSISLNTSYSDIIWETISTINLHTDLYVNSTLFEENMMNSADDTFIEQTYLENSVFFTDPVNYDDTYTVLNKILLPMGAYFYSFGDKWIIERQEDITRTGNWVYIASETTGGISTASLKQELNKQDSTGFDYRDTSQKIGYSSGLNKLTLNLVEKQLDTFTFNDYDVDMPTVSDTTPEPGTLEPRTWYIFESAINLEKKYNFREMNTCLKWQYPPDPTDMTAYQYEGLFYCFDIQFNVSADKPTELNVNYTMSSDGIWALTNKVKLQFYLRFDGGDYSGYYLGKQVLSDGTIMPAVVYFPETGLRETEVDLTSATTSKEMIWTVSDTIDLTSQFVNPDDPSHFYPSIWEMLGKPVTQRFIIAFMPVKVYHLDTSYFTISYTNYIGDISITITQTDIPNKIDYTANEDFIRTEEIDLDLFDLNNINYSNGLMCASTSESDLFIKTSAWTSENCPEAIPIADILAKNRYRNNYRTIHTLRAVILYDGHLKPFTVITDDNLIDDSSENLTLLLLNYTWDLVNGTYNIEAEEYTDQEIEIEEPGVTSEGGSSGTTYLSIPTISSVTQPIAGGPVYIEWSMVTGATGYRLQRRPFWVRTSSTTGYWAEYWQTVYVANNDGYSDYVMLEGTVIHGMELRYRVCAFNSNVDSYYSGESTINWSSF